jgi:hypothetical protein
MEEVFRLIAGYENLLLPVALGALALLFFILWITKGSGDGSSKDLQARLRKAENDARLVRGDIVHANKELERYKSLAKGEVPAETEALRRKLADTESGLQARLQTLADEHAQKVTALQTEIGRLKSELFGRTQIAPSTQALRDNLKELTDQLTAARRELAEVAERQATELRSVQARARASLAAALTMASARLEPAARNLSIDALTDPNAPEDVVRFPFLTEVEGVNPGARHFIPLATAMVGRARDCVVRLGDPMVSRQHVQLQFDGRDLRAVRMPGARNELIVNDQPMETASLQFGDVITLGSTKLRLDAEGVDALRALVSIAPAFLAALRALSTALAQDPAMADEARTVRLALERLTATAAQ